MAKSLKEQIKRLKEKFADLRFQMIYKEFDLEATRREREYYKALVEKK